MMLMVEKKPQIVCIDCYTADEFRADDIDDDGDSAPRDVLSPGSDTGSSTSMGLEKPKEGHNATGLQKPKREPEAIHSAQGVKVKTESVAESGSEIAVLRGPETERTIRNGEPRKEPRFEH